LHIDKAKYEIRFTDDCHLKEIRLIDSIEKLTKLLAYDLLLANFEQTLQP